MAKLVGIFGPSGDGKTTSTIINPDGTLPINLETGQIIQEIYNGMDPKEHFIVNLDKKELPFAGKLWSKENKNYLEVSDFKDIKKIIEVVANTPEIKSISFDTLNAFLAYKEFNDRKKMSFDQRN